MTFSQLLLDKSAPRRKAVVVWGADAHTRGAVARAIADGVIDAVFVGARENIEADTELAALSSHFSIVDACNPDDAAAKAVAMAREGKVDIIIKGLINTDNLLRAILNKEKGILPEGATLTHITAAHIPAYHKLLVFSDAAVIPYPTPAQREAQLRYLAHTVNALGVSEPKIGLVHCSEKVDGRHFPFTENYADLKKRAEAGEFGACIVDGPLDVKCCCCAEALEEKGIVSPLQGDADALIFPDIEAANSFYKTLTLFAGAEIAGMLDGTAVPVVLPSRGDSIDSKYNSILLAARSSHQ